jgi:penicillin-binding protein 2
MDVPEKQLGGVILQLARVLDSPKLPASEVLARALRSMSISMERLGQLAVEISRGSNESVEKVLRRTIASVYVDPQRYDEAATELAAASGLSPVRCARLMRLAVHKQTGYTYDFAVIRSGVGEKKAIQLRELAPSLPGVEVRKGFVRRYPQGTLAAHLLGSVGQITAEQLKQPYWSKRSGGDLVGQGGVEYAYDEYLRGTDGEGRVEVDSLGRPKRPVSGGSLPRTGGTLVLTIDTKIQKAAERALVKGIELARSDQFWNANGGAAIVMDASNGEIVAMASYPTFEPSVWQTGSEKDFKYYYSTGANRPFFDRAIQGQYAPGSTFKPITAVAALEAGLISPYTTFYCDGDYEKHGQTFKCWISPDGHGGENLIQALAESCDVYFYNVGYGFFRRDTRTELQDWSRRFGLGKLTGVDIPGESRGLVPDYKWTKEHFTDPWSSIWRSGDSIQLAIGQGYLQVTPLQMAVAYAAIANGGDIVTPHLGLRIEDASGSTIERLRQPAVRRSGATKESIEVIEQGLRYAASSSTGTSVGVFGSYPVAVCGKTGTAQVANHDDYAWYTSYAPANPEPGEKQYVVVVMIEQGGHGGSTAAPVARLIYDALFHVKTAEVTGAPTD